MARANLQTFWWSLFAAGGVVAALVLPALIFITGIALPFVQIGAVPSVHFDGRSSVLAILNHPIGRLVMFVVISLPLFHCAHRIVHTSKDLGIHNAAAHNLIALVFYGGAIAATVLAAWVIWQ